MERRRHLSGRRLAIGAPSGACEAIRLAKLSLAKGAPRFGFREGELR
jgi:hypothetical protein